MGSGWWVSCSTSSLAYLVEGHLASQPAEDVGHSYACPENHWFAELDLQITGNSFIRGWSRRLGRKWRFFVEWWVPSLFSHYFLTLTVCASPDFSLARFLCVRWLSER